MDKEFPNDIKQMCLWLVRGYDRMVRNYLKKREDIIYESPCSFATYTDKGEECRQYFEHSNAVGNPVADKQERLEAIESQPETKRMRAVHEGLIIELPCKVGDTVYLLGGKDYNEFHIGCIDWKCGMEYKGHHYQLYLEDDFYDKAYRNFSDIGKTVFLTREAAQKSFCNRTGDSDS